MHLVKDWQTHIVTFRALIAANMDQYPISELCKCTIESIATEIHKTTARLLWNTRHNSCKNARYDNIMFNSKKNKLKTAELVTDWHCGL